MRSFLPLVQKGTAKKVVFLSSILASLDFAPNVATLSVTYGVTKAGLNMYVSLVVHGEESHR